MLNSLVLLSLTWLDPSVDNSEINLPGYSLFCSDHNCCGGGVAVYCAHHLLCSVLSCGPSLSVSQKWGSPP